MKNYLLCFVLFLLLFTLVNAVRASQMTDSLEKVLQIVKEKDRGDLLLKLSIEYTPVDLNKSLEYAKKARLVFTNEKRIDLIAKSYTIAGLAYSYSNDFVNSLVQYNTALKLYSQAKDKYGVASTYNDIGLNVFYYQNRYDDAIKYFNLALKTAGDNLLAKAKAFNNLGRCLRRKGEPAKALEYFNQASKILVETDDLDEAADLYNNLGLTSFDLGLFDAAIKHYEHSGELKKKTGNEKGYGVSMNNIGNIYWQTGKLEKAISSYQEALKIFDKINYVNGVSSCLNNIGITYQLINNLPKALEFHNRALEVRLKLDNKASLAESYCNLGIVQSLIINDSIAKVLGRNWEYDMLVQFEKKAILENYKTCLASFKKSEKYSEEVGNKAGLAKALQNIGLIYNYSGYFEDALYYNKRALLLNQELQNESDQIANLIAVGSSYSKLRNFKTAEDYLNKAEILAQRLNLTEPLKQVHNYKSDLYEQSGEYKLSLLEYKKFSELKDTILNKENYKQLTELQTQYETEKQKQQIELLNKDKILNENQIKAQRRGLILSLIAVLGIVSFLIVLIKQFNAKKKANIVLAQINKELETKNNLITHQKKEITDSIMYARRIQSAILPPEELLEKELPEHFILYMPRDIVSGDFYWVSERGDKIYVVTADCTGHGVPGAFMSMLGTSLLNQIITNNPNMPVNEVLDDLRDQLIKSLHQTGKVGENKDGIDLVLYTINKTDLSLSFAGANNPLIIIRNAELIELKPDKMPIGIHDKNEHFSQQNFQLQKGDCLYSFSDGYADQCGGEKGKKFMIKKLKQLLLEVSVKPIIEQHKLLDETIKKWMEGIEQVDDILVIGVRV
jgi:serine phosphatase RsbU (regulator of sigma subunit)